MTAVQPGNFFHESWGYDQTNADFYQVTRISESGKTVWLRHVGTGLVAADACGGTKVAPLADMFDRPDGQGSRSGEMKRRLRPYDHGNGITWAVNITDYSSARLWDCKPAYETASGYGH